MVLSALFLLLQKIIQSSAYLTNLCPLRSSSLSSSFSMTFPHSGLNGPPWGTPSVLAWKLPSSITPEFKYLCISDMTLPSFIVLDSTSISLLWLTVSKYACKSMLTTYTYSSSTYSLHFLRASCAPLPGRNPKLLSENCSSKIGVSSWAIACWITLSTTVGTPSFLTFPFSSFGISTRRTGLGLYFPFRNCSTSSFWLLLK